MPTRKSKQQFKEAKQKKARAQDAAAQKAGLAAMRSKLAAQAKANTEAGNTSVLDSLPQASVRFRKSLKNRTKL
jgi:hypothetical protein